MPIFLEIAALLFVVDDVNFLGAADFGEGGRDFGAGNMRRADSRVGTVVHKQNLIEDDSVAFLVLAGKLLDLDLIADHKATGLEGDVPGEAEVLAADLAGGLEAGHPEPVGAVLHA